LTDIEQKAAYTGQANTVLVFDHGQDCTAVITSIGARVCEHEHKERIRFRGTVTFSEKSVTHVRETILPVADSILNSLDLPEKCFEISAVNIGAASVNDIGLNISGFSADVPMLLTILSAVLQIPVSDGLVSTGHIASPDGHITMVKNIPAKLNAAVKADSIDTFIYPSADPDSSLDNLTPEEKNRIVDAVATAKGNIRTVAVSDINELVREVFTKDQMVLASLRHGFYNASGVPSTRETPITKAAEYFTKNNEKRFFEALEHKLLAGRGDDSRKFLLSYARFHIHRKIYPEKIGKEFYKIVHALPPETRRLKLDFPLLPMPECIQLSQFAKESDHDDVLLLYKATFDEKTQQFKTAENGLDKDPADGRDNDKLQLILSQIDAEALTKLISLPIDSARAAYIMDSVITDSFDRFNDTLTSFYLHLLRHTRTVSDPVDSSVVGAEAFALAKRAFLKKGGIQAAFTEARTATNGGLRLVFDTITDQFKREQHEKHIDHILKLTMDPLDWEGKVALMQDILKWLTPYLPKDIVSQPPERFAAHYETLIKAYVQSMDQIKALFHSL
jgi:hypothetical protein